MRLFVPKIIVCVCVFINVNKRVIVSFCGVCVEKDSWQGEDEGNTNQSYEPEESNAVDFGLALNAHFLVKRIFFGVF